MKKARVIGIGALVAIAVCVLGGLMLYGRSTRLAARADGLKMFADDFMICGVLKQTNERCKLLDMYPSPSTAEKFESMRGFAATNLGDRLGPSTLVDLQEKVVANVKTGEGPSGFIEITLRTKYERNEAVFETLQITEPKPGAFMVRHVQFGSSR